MKKTIAQLEKLVEDLKKEVDEQDMYIYSRFI